MKNRSLSNLARRTQGYSLLEILLVIGIIVVLVGFSAQSLFPSLDAQKLSNSSSMVYDELLLARQKAVTGNSPVLVRFFKQDGAFTAFQSYAFENGERVPVSRVNRIAAGIVIHPSPVFSSLPSNAGVGNTSTLAAPPSLEGDIEEIRQFEFRPDGTINLSPESEWALTLVGANPAPVAGQLPANFATIQIESKTGRLRMHRP